MVNLKKICSIFSIIILFSLSSVSVVQVQATDTPTPTISGTPSNSPDNSQAVHDLQDKINQYQSKISEAQSQEHTLSSQIDVMDNQMKLTQYRIDSTKAQMIQLTQGISVAGNKMKNLEGSLTNVSKVLINRIVATYQAGDYGPMQVFFSSSDISDAVSKANYLRIVQDHDKHLMYDTQQAKDDYANQKQIFQTEKQQVETLQAQLESFTQQLSQEQDAKKKLLADTQGDEQNYQHLLSQAEAQLAGFQSFTRSQGGASLLGGQTVCDDWGCYYNQRDSQWGGIAINHSPYSIAEDGCLMTSMAMVMTHYGHKTTPLDINANSDNFASYAPAYLRYTISANGATASRVGASIDATLSTGNPVIVGISYDGGPYPDHFVVLVSGSGGSYIMNDPFTPSGHNISFSSHYSVGSIREIDKVVM